MKLPEISYGGVPSVNAPGPQRAVTEYAQKQNILGKAQKAATDISNAARDFNVKKADAAYEQEMSDFMVSASERDVLSPGEVNAMDLDVDTEGREYLTKAEWYPQLLAKRQDEYRGKHAATIRSPVDRKKWEEATQKVDNNILEQEVERSAQISRDFAIVEREILADQALKAGNYDLADSYYTGPEWRSSPQRKAKAAAARSEIFIARKTDEVSLAMLKADTVEGYDAVLTMTTDPKWNEGLAPGTVLLLANSVVTRRNGAITAADKRQSDAEDSFAMATLEGLTDGTLTINDVNERKEALGKDNYKSLVTASRTWSGDGGDISDPRTYGSLSTDIMLINAGAAPEGMEGMTHDEQIAEVNKAYRSALRGRDPVTGDVVGTVLSIKDGRTLGTEISDATEFPYRTEEYSNITKAMSDRILGVEEGGFQFMATDISRAIRANAVEDLRKYVNENGGMAADIGKWRIERLPNYLKGASLESFKQLPDEIKGQVVWTKDKDVDVEATAAKVTAELERVLSKPGTSPEQKQEAEDEARKAIDSLNSWLITRGLE